MNKRKLSYEEQINHLKSKGILFNKVSDTEALEYLKLNNNFFKLKSYRKNFNKTKAKDQYVHLEFAYLSDLAIIDTRLRMIILEMALNIEHFSKVNLIQKITDSDTEDGYKIVHDYINSLRDAGQASLKKGLDKSLHSPYCKDMFQKYKANMPVWVFIELISFGTYIYFYLFCAKRFNDSSMRKVGFLLKKVKTVRNAAAHNNCIINELKKKDNTHKPSKCLQNALTGIGISRNTQRKKLANEPIEQILTCFYSYKLLVASPGMQKHMAYILDEFKTRLYREFTYADNLLIKSTFDLLTKIIEVWFPLRQP
ncbi:Abi family protein [Dialister invisus]